MTELEKQVKEYCKENCGSYYYECYTECSSIEAFQDGAKWGMERLREDFQQITCAGMTIQEIMNLKKENARLKAIESEWKSCFLSCSSPYCAGHFPAVKMEGELGNMEKKEK